MPDMKLQVILEAVTAGYTAGMDQATSRIDRFVAVAGKVSTGMLAVGGAITGGLLAAVAQTAAVGGQLYDLSQRTGVSVESLSQLGLIAKTVGADVTDLARGAVFLQRNVAGAGDGGSQAADALKALGVRTREANGQFRSGEALLWDTIAALRGVGDETQKTQQAMALFGRGGMSLLPILRMTNAEYAQLQQTARKSMWTTEQARAADEWSDTMDVLKASMTALLRDAVIPLMNNLQPMIAQWANLAVSAGQFLSQHPSLSTWVFGVGAVTLALGTLTKTLLGVRDMWLMVAGAAAAARASQASAAGGAAAGGPGASGPRAVPAIGPAAVVTTVAVGEASAGYRAAQRYEAEHGPPPGGIAGVGYTMGQEWEGFKAGWGPNGLAGVGLYRGGRAMGLIAPPQVTVNNNFHGSTYSGSELESKIDQGVRTGLRQAGAQPAY